MQIEHNIISEDEKNIVYLNVYIEDIYEFGKEDFDYTKSAKNIGSKIKKYIQTNVEYIKGGIIIVAINGILIGALSMTPQKTVIVSNDVQENEQVTLDKAQNENTTNALEQLKPESQAVTVPPQTHHPVTTTTTTNNNIKDTTSKQNTTTNTPKPNTTSKPITPTPPSSNITSEVPKQEEAKPQGTYIKLNTNGVIKEMELETYIIGVVAAEMPASFNIEALKAQSVAARTYAMKKASQGITLKNSTSDQVYKTIDQMKSTWGNSFSTYYNKIKNAVNATKGLVLKYNGAYIDAQYFSMTNGKTELPENVWTYSRPYLQCVSSTWDTKVSNFEVTKTFSYEKVSSSLNQTITKDTNIQILSKTVSDRVEKIQIGDKTYTGTKLRSLLGLRSTDFTIKLNDTNIEITTRGFGHGVGMSQYGAHIAANEGYTYRQILNHYYVGAQIVQI